MEINEIREALPQCPRCGRHCPIDAVSCPRGQELVQKLQSGEMTLAEATQPRGGHEEHDGERHHHGHHHGEHGERKGKEEKE